ncbi:osmoprotectant transport system permease protein [Herbihabitans rhizosphaerae]|uniref:Osmoprotectant transport system permease protein n=1 Tax=Herbihabitans rhizosphaerae TaxID=1872711 RepID=A0A4Q7KES5_9PSEU|nr:ABC transporter permease subunit [Herbihabitans rhizosphaerae]RZS32755.1 osmoprotectant transport system permease protein [Herbihabitans rhizosphaerae]
MFGDIGTYLSSPGNRDLVLQQLLEHIYLSLLPLVLGLLVAIPLGWTATRFRWLRGLLLGGANILYTIPSLALFVILPAIIGTGITSPVNVIVALTLYTATLLVRPVVDALEAVPQHVVAAAVAMGYRPLARFFAVELPLAVPVLAAGARVASVSNISLVSVGALVGIGGLGLLFTKGFEIDYLPPIIIGILLTLILALIVDLLIVLLRNMLTRWQRVGAHVGGGS